MEFFASYTGPDFLAFYAVMLITSIFAGIWIPANLRAEGRRSELREMEEVAVLAGGKNRHAAAVISDLIARDALGAGAKNKLTIQRTEIETGSAGRSLLRKVADFDLREARSSVEADSAAIEAGLIQRGLMMDSGESTALRFYSISPYVALFLLGLYRQQAGSALGEPTGFLIMLLALTVVLAGFRFFRYSARTKAGNEALRELEVSASRLRRAPSAAEAGMSVAIFGTAALVGTPWEPVHSMHRAAATGTGGDGGGGADGDGGGGGCGGGGCGGCGG